MNTAPPTFRERVLAIVRCIPKGSTMSYKHVAEKAGNPLAARAVGSIMKTNYDPAIPCHRVTRSDGSIGGYNRGAAKKKRLLEREGKPPSSAEADFGGPGGVKC